MAHRSVRTEYFFDICEIRHMVPRLGWGGNSLDPYENSTEWC